MWALPPGSVRFDFDGDGRADLGRWRISNYEWKVKNSSTGGFTTATIGSSSSIIAPGDFDGDGKTDIAVFEAGAWTIKKSSNGQTITPSFGTTGDKPVVGDYDGDSISDLAVFRPSTNTWWIYKSSNGSYTSTAFGSAGDITAQGNFDGDTKTDIAVFRPSTGDWHVLGSAAGYFAFHWGIATDIPVPADFDGDGKTDFAVFRPSTGTWYVSKSSTNNSQYFTAVWGNYGDQPAAADYDGDGRDDFAVWRPTTGVWHIIKSNGAIYDYQTLGQAGDAAVSAAYLKQIGSAVAGYDLAKARLSPINSTGGTNLYSRNFGWGAPLAGLPGRTGLDAGFGISYNSLVWTKEPVSNAIYFDADNSNVSPGFRFGFPTIEPVYWDKNTEKFNYLMVMPSGARVEFRQLNGASDTYETADSSYAQLKTTGAANPNDAVENITITVSITDGTKLTFLWKAGAFRCSQIKDKNGNFITINHDEQGLLRTVTDTLSRVFTVNYDAELYPTSVTQTWKSGNGDGANVTHTWATFTYTTLEIATNFSGLTVVGPANGTVIKVLQKITFPSETDGAGASTVFSYTSWGQVKQITSYAADNHELNHVAVNLPATAANPQTDCPRFTETRANIENFNGGNDVVFYNSIPAAASYSLPDGHSGTATKIEVSMAGDPYNHVLKTFLGGSGWQEGLTIATEDWANGANGAERKRWTWTSWTQDNTNLAYLQNPRVTESKVGDTTNVKRTTTEYYLQPNTSIANYGLVKESKIYDADQTTVLKKSYVEYNLDSVYTSRRIIGLPSLTEAYGLNQQTNVFEKVSKVTYQYDEGNFNDSSLEQNISSVIQHDNTNYGASFIAGRANLTSTTRHDVTGQTSGVTASVKYNIAGAPVAQIDAAGKTIKIGYADNFNDTATSRNTFAYPTRLTELSNTDSSNNFSLIKYRFDIGANVWAKSPAPAGNTTGMETTRLYDSSGRLTKQTLVNTGAYTRYEYPANQIQSKVFSTVIDANNDGAGTDDEVLNEAWMDGTGRVLRSRTEHPNSSGGWTASLTEYNILGQVTRVTVPTEISVSNPGNPNSWTPTGDDNRGVDSNGQPIWLWTQQEYDWKGRVTREVNTDGTDTLASFEGCGCAGGQVTTIESELVPRNDQPNQNARRMQKIYEDILGRAYKTEVYNWDDTTVYTTTVHTFNGRDQIVKTRQYAGTTNSSSFQDLTTSFDGHGRMRTRHYPIEDAGTETTWIYNSDDSIQSVIDPRNVITDFSYNSRGLLSGISFQKPTGSTIPEAPNVSYSYDALGNRTQMTDGLGTVNYEYDSLSRLKSETRQFNTSLADAPSGGYKIQYSFNLSGGLKSVTDPFNSVVNYTNDKTGRLTGVAGTAYGDNTTGEYADNIKYRAFGEIKQIDYKTSDNGQVRFSYDNRLRVAVHEVLSNTRQSGYLTKAVFSYSADNRPQAMDNQVNHQFDRSFKYDFAGRLTGNSFGTGQGTAPYSQTLQYDAFSQLTQRNAMHWNNAVGFSASYVNGRKQVAGALVPVYDASGNLIDSGVSPSNTFQTSAYDEANRQSSVTTRVRQDYGDHVVWVFEQTQTQSFDGDGHQLKTTETWQRITNPPSQPSVKSKYQIWSSVLGSALTELTDTGAKSKTRVFAGDAVIAEQVKETNLSPVVKWLSADPVTGSYSSIRKDGTSYDQERKEFEALGQEILPVEPPEDPQTPQPDFVPVRSADDPEWLCGLSSTNDLNFWDKPVQCQIAIIESNSFSRADLIIKGNTQKVSQSTGSPTIDFEISASDEILTYATLSTAKQTGDKPKKKKPTLKRGRGKRPDKPPIVDPKTEKEVKKDVKPSIPVPFDFDNPNYETIDRIIESVDFMKKTVKYIGFSREQELEIEARLLAMLSSESCVNAFNAFPGLKATPAEVLRDRGITFVNSTVLGDPSIESQLGIANPGRVRQELLSHIQGGAQAVTISPVENPGDYEKFPNQRIITAINLGNRHSNLNEDLFHEMIHGGGVPGKPFVRGMLEGLPGFPYSHDLQEYGDSYNNLIKACN